MKSEKNKHRKNEAFRVPEGYFEGFQDRLMEKIAEQDSGKKALGKTGRIIPLRIAVAAALVGIALLSIPLFNNIGPEKAPGMADPDIALLEGTGFFNDDMEMAKLMETGDEAMDDDEAYLDLAIEYLAMNDVEMDLYFE